MYAELPGKVGKIEREDIIKGQKKILSMEEVSSRHIIFRQVEVLIKFATDFLQVICQVMECLLRIKINIPE